jgi:DNA replication protein DnaC
MSAAARAAVIQEHLQTLKLPAFRRSYEALARQAGADGWAYEDYLRELLEAEVRSRQERAAACRLREAHFPDVKTLDQIDWQALSGISRPQILEPAAGGDGAAGVRAAGSRVGGGGISLGWLALRSAAGYQSAERNYS